VTTVTVAAAAAAATVSTSIASTTVSRVCGAKIGASRVLAAARRLTAMTTATSVPDGAAPLLVVPRMGAILPAPPPVGRRRRRPAAAR
jgi:hypothetical protein